MHHQKPRRGIDKLWFITMTWAILLGCGEDQNPLAFVVLDESRQSQEYLLAEAESALNQGDFEQAILYGEKAYAVDPNSESTAIILCYAYLGSVGIDPLIMGRKMIEKNEAKETAAKEADPNSTSTTEDTTSGSNPLGPLADLISIPQSELDALGVAGNTVTTDTGIEVLGAPTEGLFKDLPVIIPKTAVDARRENRGTLSKINAAIRIICPFVLNEARVLADLPDPRHTGDVCPPSQKNLQNTGKAHFVWAFAHLTEAIAFNSVVLYDPTGEGPNLVRRSDILGDSQTVGIAEYIKGVNDLAIVMEEVLPTNSTKAANSMLTAMVNDLKATSNAFDLMPGMPANMTKSIKESLTKLEEQKQAIKDKTAVSDAEAGNTALKDALTEELGKTIETQITDKVAAGEVTDEQKTEVCAAYAEISATAIDVCSI